MALKWQMLNNSNEKSNGLSHVQKMNEKQICITSTTNDKHWITCSWLGIGRFNVQTECGGVKHVSGISTLPYLGPKSVTYRRGEKYTRWTFKLIIKNKLTMPWLTMKKTNRQIIIHKKQRRKLKNEQYKPYKRKVKQILFRMWHPSCCSSDYKSIK